MSVRRGRAERMMIERAGEKKEFSKERWRKMEKDGKK